MYIIDGILTFLGMIVILGVLSSINVVAEKEGILGLEVFGLVLMMISIVFFVHNYDFIFFLGVK